MPSGRHVDVAAAGPPRVGEHALPHGRSRRVVDARGNRRDGRLPDADSRSGEVDLTRRGGPSGPPDARHSMRELVAQLLSNGISRRDFVRRLVASGVTATAANSILQSVDALAQNADAPASPDAVKVVQGTGGEAFAEQLIASGVKYVFGNSASEDAEFYEALVNRPQLQYILTPHEGPGAAMAAGYVKASGQPAIVMMAGSVGLMNALGQMFNAWKEQTPLVFYAYRTEDSNAAGRDGFEELPGQELLALPVTQARQVHASFPQQHPLWVGNIPGARVESLSYPTEVDLVINIGNKLQPNSASLIVSRKTKFIDMRNDGASVGSVLRT